MVIFFASQAAPDITVRQMGLDLKPGACAMATHVVLAEIGGDCAVEMVDTTNGETASAKYRESDQ
jgi:hypothetical protein